MNIKNNNIFLKKLFIICFFLLINNYIYSNSEYTIPRSVQYSYIIKNQTSKVIPKIEFLTYAPVKQTSTQLCKDIQTSYPYKLINDEYGNQILSFTFENLPPFAVKIISIKVSLLLSESPVQISPDSLPNDLLPDYCIESDSTEVMTLAKQLQLDSSLKTAQVIYDWIISNIKYAGYIAEPKGALYALKNMSGDCTEYMSLFVALSRANNIPARALAGFVLENDAVVKSYDYHNWAVFNDGKVWRVADAQKNNFLKKDNNYIAMQVLNSSKNQTFEIWERYKVIGDGVSVNIEN